MPPSSSRSKNKRSKKPECKQMASIAIGLLKFQKTGRKWKTSQFPLVRRNDRIKCQHPLALAQPNEATGNKNRLLDLLYFRNFVRSLKSSFSRSHDYQVAPPDTTSRLHAVYSFGLFHSADTHSKIHTVYFFGLFHSADISLCINE
jgi:hypothetical protein